MSCQRGRERVFELRRGGITQFSSKDSEEEVDLELDDEDVAFLHKNLHISPPLSEIMQRR